MNSQATIQEFLDLTPQQHQELMDACITNNLIGAENVSQKQLQSLFVDQSSSQFQQQLKQEAIPQASLQSLIPAVAAAANTPSNNPKKTPQQLNNERAHHVNKPDDEKLDVLHHVSSLHAMITSDSILCNTLLLVKSISHGVQEAFTRATLLFASSSALSSPSAFCSIFLEVPLPLCAL